MFLSSLRFVGVDDNSVDLGSELSHFSFEIFVTAIQVVNAANLGFAFGD